MSKTSFVLAGAVLCVAFALNAEAKLYKWVDDQGVTHYGETIPPEYANRDTKVFDKGRITDRDDGFDDKQKNSAKKETAEDKAAKEAKRRDDALLNSFSNEKEIDLARDRALLQIEARINSFTTLIKSAQSNLDDLHKEYDRRTSLKAKIPESLTEDITNAEGRLAKLQKDLDNNQKEFQAVTDRYAAEKQRFLELKGKQPQAK
jgi:chromosome segregation ATPase